MSNSPNPYAVSTVDIGLGLGNDAEATRRQYLNHEASVKSIGTLYMLGGVLNALLAIFYMVLFFVILLNPSIPDRIIAVVSMAIASGFMAVMAAGTIITAIGLWRLRPWARIVGTVLSCFGLVAIPIGTLICIYFLYLLQCQKANVIFSNEYQTVIAQTPHIHYRTSWLVWLLLGILVLVVAVIAVLAISVG